MAEVIIQKMTPLTALSIIAARIKRRKLIIDWDDLDSAFQTTFLRACITRVCERFLPGFSDTVTVHCPYLAQQAKLHKARHIVYLPQAVDTRLFDPFLYDAIKAKKDLKLPDKPVLGLVSTCTKGGMKDLDELLGHMQPVMQGSNFYFLIVAGGPLERQVRERLQRIIPSGQFCLTGIIAHKLIPLYIAAMDGCVIWMRDDAGNRARVSLKLLEYLAMKKPVFGSVTGFSAEKLGRFVMPLDGLNYGNFSLTCKAAETEAGRAIVLKEFSIESMSNVLRTLLL